MATFATRAANVAIHAKVEKARYLECDGIFSLIAGVQCRRNGLLAASGVHFWTDIVWHVVFPLLKLSIY